MHDQLVHSQRVPRGARQDVQGRHAKAILHPARPVQPADNCRVSRRPGINLASQVPHHGLLVALVGLVVTFLVDRESGSSGGMNASSVPKGSSLKAMVGDGEECRTE